MTFSVLLTGSTGNLGAYILDQLLQEPRVTQIFCLNRSTDARSKHIDSRHMRGLESDIEDEARVRFIHADFGKERLGLADEEYHTLAKMTDVVIHNAWPVNFNLNFSSFKSSLTGILHLVRFCQDGNGGVKYNNESSPHSPISRQISLCFISSIGTTSNWSSAAPSSVSQVPEAELKDWKIARTGYGQSKLVAERLLTFAAANNGIEVAIIRVGQLSGPVMHGSKGQWPQQEWIPSIIKSSIVMLALPETLGPQDIVDWVPVDISARIIVELTTHFWNGVVLNTRSENKYVKPKRFSHRKPEFYHLVNPRSTSWSAIRPAIEKRLPSSTKTVPFVEWVDTLKHSEEPTTKSHRIDGGIAPVVKLMELFDYLQDRAIRFPFARAVKLDTSKAIKASATLAALQPVNAEWMELWMSQWNIGGKYDSMEPDERLPT